MTSKPKKSTKQGPVKPVPQFETKTYEQMRMIRDIAMADKPDPKWRPKVGDLVFIPATVDEQVEAQNARYGWVDYVQKKNPVLSPRALVARVIAYTQCDDLIKIRDVEDQVWKCTWVKSRFVLVSAIRPFRGWEEERRKRLDPVT